ncbi:MAG: hypothetical protein KGZ25_15730, partial [Planctomycetes bacterium]|nr:hypothetical protein [Planctomycetota bacterium]
MKWFKRMSFGLLLFATAVVSGARRKGIDSCFKNLPSGWGIVKSFRVSADQLPAIEGKLGARIESLSNTVLSVHGRRIQVNLIDCPSKEDAKKIYSSVSALKGD